MNYLHLRNLGEIDIRSITHMGLTSKRNDETTIGRFGTGLKYAIAGLVRMNNPVMIYSGADYWPIETKNIEHRGVRHREIMVNGQNLNITDQMGPDWEPWELLRELISNTLDEATHTVSSTSYEPEGVCEAGFTNIVIPLVDEGLQEVVQNINTVFGLDRTPIYHCKKTGIKLYEPQQGVVYTHGIACHHNRDHRQAFDYELPGLTLNEQRRASKYQMEDRIIQHMLGHCDDRAVVSRYLHATGCLDHWESSHNGSVFCDYTVSDTTQQVMQELPTAPANFKQFIEPHELPSLRVVSADVFNMICKKLGISKLNLPSSLRMANNQSVAFRTIKATPSQMERIAQCAALMERHGHCCEYPVDLVKFEDPGLLGLADRETGSILLSERLFDTERFKQHEIFLTLFEEYVHLHYGVNDCTRDMQEQLISVVHKLMLKYDEAREVAA